MDANILQGVYVRVGGEAGRTNGLPWRILENMFGHLQELILLLAKYELETDNSPSLKDFQIELIDFKKGSAIPAFRVIPEQQQFLIPVIEEQREVVAKNFDRLMSYANQGAYERFFTQDQLPEVRHSIAEELYGFILAAERSPLSIVQPLNGNGQYREIYKVQRFTKEQTELLLKPTLRRKKTDEPEQILALVQRVGKRRTILDLYENKDTLLSVAPAEIVTGEKVYHLYNPLLCTVYKEDGNYIIENEMLDLYASGSTIDLAEHDLYNEFDESYQLLNSLPDNELSDRLLRAKNLMNTYIKEITTN